MLLRGDTDFKTSSGGSMCRIWAGGEESSPRSYVLSRSSLFPPKHGCQENNPSPGGHLYHLPKRLFSSHRNSDRGNDSLFVLTVFSTLGVPIQVFLSLGGQLPNHQGPRWPQPARARKEQRAAGPGFVTSEWMLSSPWGPFEDCACLVLFRFY